MNLVPAAQNVPLEYLKSQVREDRYFGDEDLSEEWVSVEESDWTQVQKYQSAELIVKHIPTQRHFSITNTRSGSYHTDWYYQAPEICEVTREVNTVEVVTWKEIKA